MKDTAQEIRLRYLYRRMILEGKAKISLEAARGLVGPDCAYHLYSIADSRKRPKARSRPRR